MTRHANLSRLLAGGLICALAFVGACDSDVLEPPTAVHSSLVRYVAIGNSITAGYQSGGINDSTQAEAFPVLLAEAFGLDVGTEFVVPELNSPGCPPPYVNVFLGERLGGAAAPPCALLKAPTPTIIHNVGVPGAAVIDATDNFDPTSRSNALTTFILGGRTQVEAAAEAQPTFVSVEIGNNDVLGGALTGNATIVTPAATFTANYEALTAELQSMGVERGVLVGVFGVTNIPNLSPGAAYWVASQTPGALPPTFTVNANCAPAAYGGVGETMLVPFGYGFGTLIAGAAQGMNTALDCVNDAAVLTGAEIVAISTAVASYNATIAAEAADLGWAYLDPNPILDSLRTAGEIPLFPNAAGPDAVTRPFGDFLSRDGVHPTGAAHRIIADHIIDALNATYDDLQLTGGQ